MDSDSAAVKEIRQALRLVQEHLLNAHFTLGAQCESIGLVDVIYHPENRLPALNYTTPRKNTAWVSAKEIAQGLDYLRSAQRTARVSYIEGLFPAMFAKTLSGLGLAAEQETPIMLFYADKTPLNPAPLPNGMTLHHVTDQRGIEAWWYVWRNAHYDVISLGVEPLFVGQDIREISAGRQIDILLYHHGFPAGVARMTIYNETAHIAGLALMKEIRTAQMQHALQTAAIQLAIERGCKLIFAPGDTDTDRQLCRQIGFMDSGSIVCYSEKSGNAYGDHHDVFMAQPVLVLR